MCWLTFLSMSSCHDGELDLLLSRTKAARQAAPPSPAMQNWTVFTVFSVPAALASQRVSWACDVVSPTQQTKGSPSSSVASSHSRIGLV